MPSNGDVPDGSGGTATQALRRMAEGDPELAARMILHSMPAAGAALRGLSYRLELAGLGAWRVMRAPIAPRCSRPRPGAS